MMEDQNKALEVDSYEDDEDEEVIAAMQAEEESFQPQVLETGKP